MKLNLILSVVLISGASALFTGCVGTVDGGNKAAVPFRKDRIEGRYERSVSQVFDASKVILNRLGRMNSENTINHSLVAKVDDRNVWVRVEEVDPKVTRVTVQVRTRAGGVDIDLAAQIEKEIALHLAAGR